MNNKKEEDIYLEKCCHHSRGTTCCCHGRRQGRRKGGRIPSSNPVLTRAFFRLDTGRTHKKEREKEEKSLVRTQEDKVWCFVFLFLVMMDLEQDVVEFGFVFFFNIYIRLEDHNLMTEETGAPKQPRRRLQRTYTKSHHT